MGLAEHYLLIPMVAPDEGFHAGLSEYGAAVTEAESMRDREVFVVGGGNSAGQAAVHLSRFAKQVTMVIRNSSLAASTSDYLIREIHVRDNITILTNARVEDGGEAESLEFVEFQVIQYFDQSWEQLSNEGLLEPIRVLMGAERRPDDVNPASSVNESRKDDA